MICYIATYNAPKQLEHFFENNHFLFSISTIYLIDNSDVQEHIDANKEFCSHCVELGIPLAIIHQGENLGIGIARRLASQHFIQHTKEPYMMYFEDDFVVAEEGFVDSCGFRNNISPFDVTRFCEKAMTELRLDYLKLSFQEVFGHNGQNWGYRNMSEKQKAEYEDMVDARGFSEDAAEHTPFTQIRHIDGTPIALGNIFYGNWPQVTSRDFAIMFIETQISFFEQAMAARYTLSFSNLLRSAVVLGTIFKHNRIQSYTTQRKEV